MERQAKDGTIYQSVGDDSWSPVTRMAKDGTVYKKVGDDSWSPMQSAVPQQKESSMLDTQLPFGTTPRGIIQGGLNALPTAGMVVGGALGSPADIFTGPIGTAVGAGVGAAGGQALKEAGERFILGKNKSNTDVLKSVAMGVPEGMAGEMGGQVLGKGLSAAAKTPVGKALIDKAGTAGAKVGELFTGVPEQEIKTYAKNAPEINTISAENDHNAQDIADQVRAKVNETIQTHRKGLNDQISTALEGASKEKNVDVTPVIRALEAQRAKLDPKLHAEDIADVNELIKRVSGKAPLETPTAYQANTSARTADLSGMTNIPDSANGELLYKSDSPMAPGEHETPVINNAADEVIKLPTKDKYVTNAQGLHTIQKWLQDKASSAYGQTAVGFQVGDQGAKAAKGAAGAAREILGEVSPEVAAANTKLARLHQIEDVMNKNMLTEGKTAGPLNAAGSGANPANAKILRQLGEETGTDILGEAQKLSAARTFGKPQLMPVDSTGKAAGRVGLAALIGFATGGPAGAATAAAMTSPAALKVAIDAGRALGTPTAMALAEAASKALIKSQSDISIPNGSSAPSPTNEEPTLKPTDIKTKGPDKWAKDGHQKLMDHAEDPKDQEMLQKSKGAMISDPKSKQLLIQASDLKPGSKAMESVLSKIKAKAKVASDE